MLLRAAIISVEDDQKDVYEQYRDYRLRKVEAPPPAPPPAIKPSWAILLEGIEQDLS